MTNKDVPMKPDKDIGRNIVFLGIHKIKSDADLNQVASKLDLYEVYTCILYSLYIT